MKKEKSAGAIIFYEDRGKIYFLLLKYFTYWGLMKGIIESNEKIIDTVIREAKEETNLDNLKIIPGFRQIQKWFFRSYNDKKELIGKEAIYLLAEITKQEAENVKISHEHEDFAFLEFEDCLKKIKVKANKEMLEEAYDFIKEIKKQKTFKSF